MNHVVKGFQKLLLCATAQDLAKMCKFTFGKLTFSDSKMGLKYFENLLHMACTPYVRMALTLWNRTLVLEKGLSAGVYAKLQMH